MDVAIGLCSCYPPCGRIKSTGWYCKADKKMHLGFYSLGDFVDILINHETIHDAIYKLEGLETTKKFNYMFISNRKEKPTNLNRKNCLEVLREDGTPNFERKSLYRSLRKLFRRPN